MTLPAATTPSPTADSENRVGGRDFRDSAWLRLLERAFGGWAPTLRGSLVLVTIFLCSAVLMVVALGVIGLALAAGLAVVAGWLNAAGRLPRA